MSDKDDKPGLKKAQDVIRRMFEGFPEWQRKRLMQSHCIQAPEEKKARVKLVQELSLELDSIRGQNTFATAFGDSAIEAVIEGDWKRVADHSDWLTFREEHEDLRSRVAPLWAKFVEMLRTACVEARHREERLYRQVTGTEEKGN